LQGGGLELAVSFLFKETVPAQSGEVFLSDEFEAVGFGSEVGAINQGEAGRFVFSELQVLLLGIHLRILVGRLQQDGWVQGCLGGTSQGSQAEAQEEE
jgi:hypothetical protein